MKLTEEPQLSGAVPGLEGGQTCQNVPLLTLPVTHSTLFRSQLLTKRDVCCIKYIRLHYGSEIWDEFMHS